MTRETIKGRFFILTKRIEPVTSILVIIIHSKKKLCQILVYGLQYYLNLNSKSPEMGTSKEKLARKILFAHQPEASM